LINLIEALQGISSDGLGEMIVCSFDESEYGVGEEITLTEIMSFEDEDFMVLRF